MELYKCGLASPSLNALSKIIMDAARARLIGEITP